jgi:prophage antirepressor-like protein
MEKEKNKLVVFQDKSIRRVLVEDEWFFSVVDVVAALTDSANAGAYWRKLKQTPDGGRKSGRDVLSRTETAGCRW